MTAPGTGQTLNAAEAEQAVVSLEKIMDRLEQTVDGGDRARARRTSPRSDRIWTRAKIECARLYAWKASA